MASDEAAAAAASGWGLGAGAAGAIANAVFSSITGSNRGGLSRVSAAWRSQYGPYQMREHHLVPQELLRDPRFTNRLRAMGYDPRHFVHQRIVDITNSLHEELHAGGWNQQWQLFLDANPSFTVRDIERQIAVLREMYGVPGSTRMFLRAYGRN
jgi:hypothetical protein